MLEEVNLTIGKGTLTAIVGPNGSGKTTLIKSLLGLVHIDRGEITIDGRKVNGDCAYRKEIGYMPQIARYPENLKVRELLGMLKDLRGVREGLDEELVEQLEIGREMEKPLRTLSGGTRQKVGAVIAFLFNPKLMILDEPTAALDPVSSSRLKDKIVAENRKGKTVLLTSHNMNEIEELSEQIVFLLEGRIYFQGLIADLKRQSGEQNLERAVAALMRGARP
ncbi:ABC transporter ATP-binding protein [Geomesophilobacter sediminis]|uniref:ABC transporter ATP-binding protein n=1 Tax=Geomesophilobacter sediminis TaxID=2798584 RepID=A0A8J7J0I9_9BACT|nr:ABC transporter ATP-binding protein [Geomesophilobacter sediminis]MBJ6723913.1 ABC transporter ATP-binding protein [Geomesophilobacter sediminis]